MAIGTAAGLVFLAAAVRVEGTTACPHPDQVAARLGALLSADVPGARPDRARIWDDGDDVAVELDGSDGTLIGARRFPRRHGCEDLAAALAVSIAGWESDVHPEFSPHLIEGAPPPTVTKPAAPDPLPPRQWAADAGLSLGVGGSLDPRATTEDAVLGGWLTPPSRRTSLRFGVGGQMSQQIALQYGRASWRRWAVDLGLERPFWTSREGKADGWLHGFALARLAWLEMHGEGFVLDRSDSAIDPGLAAGLRATMTRGRLASWVELAASWWPVRHNVQAAGLGDVGRLPVAEAFVRVGVGVRSLR